jgi:hypothetical protein
LKGLYPVEPEGNAARHLNTMAAMICGIVGSGRTNLPQVAGKVPSRGLLRESLIKRFSRWVNNDSIDIETCFLPYAEALIAALAHLPLVLVMDGSAVGRGCATLILSVVYKKRALPLVWLVVKGSKGHFPEDCHLSLLEQAHPLIPVSDQVVFLGDGEFDGIDVQDAVNSYGWQYVCRTAKNIKLSQDDRTFSFQTEQVSRGSSLSFKDVYFTSQVYGPVHAIAWWEEEYEEPIYLVTNIPNVKAAIGWYKKRFTIETFFSDQKSRGFHLHKSHLSDPDRLARLMIAACLAYIWIVYLGVFAEEDGWVRFIHRSDRCDLSLFQLGLRLLEYFLNEGEDLPDEFHVWQFGPS